MTDEMPVDPDTMKLGLLLETAQNHQDLADDSLKQLQAHTLGLDGVIRDEVRRAVVAELGELVHYLTSATSSLRELKRAAQLRAVWSSAVLVSLPAGVIAIWLWWWTPSPSQILTLRAQQQQLAQSVARLAQSGGRIDLRPCGVTARLCVRVDLRAPRFGVQSDYLIVQGY